MVLKENPMHLNMQQAMALKKLTGRHKDEAKQFNLQQFADGFSTSHQPPPEERDAALLDFQRKQMQERELAMQGIPIPRMNPPPMQDTSHLGAEE
mgnify:FL=1